jgi:uncharacterized protein
MDPLQRFQERLDEHHNWPCEYVFKFIAPSSKAKDLTALFNEEHISTKLSSNERFIALTARVRMESSKDVLEIYRRASVIPEIIML